MKDNAVEIRQMNIRDYKKAYDLWKRTPGMGLSESDSNEHIKNFLKKNKGLCFVAESNNEIIGTILCGEDGRRAYIYHLAIDKDYRGHGYGKMLMNSCISELRKRSIIKAHLLVFADNNIGIAFWEKEGWKRRLELIDYSYDIG